MKTCDVLKSECVDLRKLRRRSRPLLGQNRDTSDDLMEKNIPTGEGWLVPFSRGLSGRLRRIASYDLYQLSCTTLFALMV